MALYVVPFMWFGRLRPFLSMTNEHCSSTKKPSSIHCKRRPFNSGGGGSIQTAEVYGANAQSFLKFFLKKNSLLSILVVYFVSVVFSPLWWYVSLSLYIFSSCRRFLRFC